MTGLTGKEVELLECCVSSDEHWPARDKDAHRIAGGKHQGAGLIGSLVRKGLVYDEDAEDPGEVRATPDGVNALAYHKLFVKAGLTS